MTESGPSLTFEAVLRREHFADLSAQTMKRFGAIRWTAYLGISYLVATFFAVFGLMRLSRSAARPVDQSSWLGPDELVLMAFMAGALMTLVLVWGMNRLVQYGYVRGVLREGGSYLGRRRYTLDDQGIRAVGEHGDALTRWSAILELTETPQTFLLWTDPGAAVMVPRDAFNGDEELTRFVAFVKARVATTP